ncbi:MAG: hypothetical protein HC933_04455 [Pleurocapsa sp. SU_196_0]|nr:hypothetical protein [Pleurocapsa sp. SU_196_0]
MSIFVLVLSILTSSAIARFQPVPLEPPGNPFNGRTTMIPNTSIVPVEPIIDILSPIQQVFETACGTLSSIGSGVSKQLAFLCTARDIVNDASNVILDIRG